MIVMVNKDPYESHTSCLICSKTNVQPFTLSILRKNNNGNINAFNLCGECLQEMSDDLINEIQKGG